MSTNFVCMVCRQNNEKCSETFTPADTSKTFSCRYKPCLFQIAENYVVHDFILAINPICLSVAVIYVAHGFILAINPICFSIA
jgi:hypothetical protein